MVAASAFRERRGRVVGFQIFLARVLNPLLLCVRRMSVTALSADAMNVPDKCLR